MSIIQNLKDDLKIAEMYANYWMNMAVTGVGKKRNLFHGTNGPEFTDEEKIQDCMDTAYRHIKRMDDIVTMIKEIRTKSTERG